jgi:hypothetical protein
LQQARDAGAYSGHAQPPPPPPAEDELGEDELGEDELGDDALPLPEPSIG